MKSELHEKVFQFCEQYRKTNPDFFYWLRQRTTSRDRLAQGMWFPGTHKYAFVGLYNRLSGNLSTKSFGLLFRNKEGEITAEIEIIFKAEKDPKVIAFYQEAIELIGGFTERSSTHYKKVLDKEDAFSSAWKFLDTYRQDLDKLVRKHNVENIFITEESFSEKLDKTMEYRDQLAAQRNINYIIVNITWNSKNWTEPTQEKSSHKYVAEGGIPAESWNFDFDNQRNNQEIIYGFSQFNHPPKVSGDNNLIIFSSQNQIVGFYGKAEILDRPYVETMDQDENYNLAGNKALSLCLENKIENVKEKGYLEDKKRIGQIGFTYLKSQSTILKIIDEAIELNPSQEEKLNNLKKWVMKEANFENTLTHNSGFIQNQPLNLIMFGPPGTGKTYHTVGEAMKIIDPEFYKENKDYTQRKAFRQKYHELLIKDWEATTGQIGFCTFHQSFSYEDFVEGIRPMEPQEGDTYLKYKVEEGVFKRICRLAEDSLKSLSQKARHLISIPAKEFANTSFYKISLGDINDPADQDIYDYCAENGVISIGFGDGIDFTDKDESGVTEAYTEKYKDNGFGAQAINFFKNYLKVGNYVVVSKGNFYVRAIGKVTDEYFYDPKTTIRHKHFRKVEWLFKNQEIPIQDIYEKNLSQQTIYKLKSDWIKREFFVKSSETTLPENNTNPKKFVLIIDEINRGNVASIFGELITLIEPDKRAGNNEATEVVLPYSKEKFSVPDNLYIIGTMNTADRSIEALDTALRRRFSFREMPPRPELIKSEGALKDNDGHIGEIDLVLLLKTINKRLEKLIDKDHRIGHSYFMHIKTEPELKIAFKDKVIPLLEEYFFGDFGKIGLVLGSSFVEKLTENAVFATFDEYGDAKQDLAERPVYKIKDPNDWDFISIYQ